MRLTSFLLIIITALPASCTHKQQQQVRQLPFYTSPDLTPHWLDHSPAALDTIHTIASFNFTDQAGDTVTEKTFDGKIYVADFFFTACPGICKQLTNGMSKVQEAFKNDGDVLLISHSVTPEKDNQKVLNNYAMKHGVINGKWHLVTGKKKDIYTLARASYFADEDLGLARNENDFLHTENILLIDKKRRIRGVYKGTDPAEINNLADDIKVLEKE